MFPWLQLPGGEFHNVHTVSTQPSCYMYTFVNQTEIELMENITAYEKMRAAETGELEAALNWLTETKEWISNDIHCLMWDVITDLYLSMS